MSSCIAFACGRPAHFISSKGEMVCSQVCAERHYGQNIQLDFRSLKNQADPQTIGPDATARATGKIVILDISGEQKETPDKELEEIATEIKTWFDKSEPRRQVVTNIPRGEIKEKDTVILHKNLFKEGEKTNILNQQSLDRIRTVIATFSRLSKKPIILVTMHDTDSSGDFKILYQMRNELAKSLREPQGVIVYKLVSQRWGYHDTWPDYDKFFKALNEVKENTG